MIVTIDGPAGAGKSSVTRLLAKELGFEFLDTGAMYRAVTWCAVDRKMDLTDEPGLCELAKTIKIEFDGESVFVNGQEVTDEIRDPDITRQVVHIANAESVREHLVELQRRIADTGDFVSEGRDQGTVAFPNAFCKIFLTASSQARALRRVDQMKERGDFVDFDQVLREQETRDHQDTTRKVGRLVQADDAVEVNTDHHTLEEVLVMLEKIVREKMAS